MRKRCLGRDLIRVESFSLLSAETQDFRGFYATARVRITTIIVILSVNEWFDYLFPLQYWKLTIADNFGDHTTCLSEVQFFGIGKKPVPLGAMSYLAVL